MNILISSIFPSERGNLVIGRYPHSMRNEDAKRLADPHRCPFLVIEMVEDEMIVRAAQLTFESARKYMEGSKSRWMVFPVNYTGDTSMIYGG